MFHIQARRFDGNRSASAKPRIPTCSFSPLGTTAFGLSGLRQAASYLSGFRGIRNRTPRSRNFDTDPRYSYRYELQSDQRLG
jgi:hypothetical protein